ENETARIFLKHGPDVVIHTAYRQADEEVWGAVVKGTHNVALAAHRADARLIHLSSDLVFDGEREGRYTEDDEPRPVSLYGDAKLAAERLVRELHPEALTVRTSLLYGTLGAQEALALRDDVEFYTDEIRTPARVDEVAAALLELAATDVAGVLHVAGRDALSRYELARLLAAAHGRDPDTVRGAPHPQGVDHQLCQRVTDVLRDYLREYSIDVSSPGVERPVRTASHFRNAVGRRVALRTAERRVRGEVLEADERAVKVGVDGDALDI